MARVKLVEQKEEPKKKKNNYGLDNEKPKEFISTGCTLLDCALGGGWPLGRMSNIVGDKSTAKTALAMEAMANFYKSYPKGKAAYRESEAAFDKSYARAAGIPVHLIDFGNDNLMDTVEELYHDYNKFIDRCLKHNYQGIYALDSLDALSDAAELDREFEKGSYSMNKQKKIGELFRRLVRKTEQSRTHFLVVSQVRELINVAFGERYTRSGGKAMDFYATHIVWLAHTGILKRRVKGIERAYGISVRARVKKNKVVAPFREADFDYVFGYGVDDLVSSCKWLKELNLLRELGVNEDVLTDIKNQKLPDDEYWDLQQKARDITCQMWNEVEQRFKPTRQKYTW